jgi:hypothetical protein
VPITGAILKEKPVTLYNTMHQNDGKFGASQGCLQRFKIKFGIRLLKIMEKNYPVNRNL